MDLEPSPAWAGEGFLTLRGRSARSALLGIARLNRLSQAVTESKKAGAGLLPAGHFRSWLRLAHRHRHVNRVVVVQNLPVQLAGHAVAGAEGRVHGIRVDVVVRPLGPATHMRERGHADGQDDSGDGCHRKVFHRLHPHWSAAGPPFGRPYKPNT